MGKSNTIPECSTARQLVRGDWEKLEQLAAKLLSYCGPAGEAAGRLRALDKPGLWVGKAAEGFSQRLVKLPKTLDTVTPAFGAAASALYAYATVLRLAQGEVAYQVIPAAEEARRVSREHQAAVQEYKAAESQGEDKTVCVVKPPDKDPGRALMKAAEQQLGRVKDRVDDARDACEKVWQDRTEEAPTSESWQYKMATSPMRLLEGAGETTASTVEFLEMVQPTRLLTGPKDYLTDLNKLRKGLDYAITHPVELAKSVVDWEAWKQDPARATGRLLPDLLLAFLTGGSSKALTTTERAAKDMADVSKKAEVDAKAKADADAKANQTCRTGEAVCTGGDPVDVVTGEMLLPQTDVTLAGALPLVFARQHRSTFRSGRWFGLSWASTLDQHLELGLTEVVLTTADGLRLRYPVPGAGAEGAVLPAVGARWPLSWDGVPGGVFTVTDPLAGVSRSFRPLPGVRPDGISGRLVVPVEAVSDRSGNRMEVVWDDAGVPVEIVHSGGYRIGVDTDRARGRVTGLRLLGEGWVQPAEPSGISGPQSPSGLPGPSLTKGQDLNGSSSGEGALDSYGHPADGDVPLVAYRYTGAGDLAEVVNSSGDPLVFTYDDEHRITSWTDRNGTWYRYEYDNAGRCVHGTGSAGALDTRFAYDEANRTSKVTDSLGQVREFVYNTLFQVVAETDPLGHTTVQEWDRSNRLLAVTDPLGRTTSYVYDGPGNLLGVVRADGAVAVAEYDAELGRPTAVTGLDGTRTRYRWDEAGRLLSQTDPAGAQTTYTYDDFGHLATVVNALGHTVQVVCDRAGLPVQVTDPLGAVTRIVRDAFGRVVEVTDPLGAVTRSGWTTEGKPAWRSAPDGAREEWVWDGEGNLRQHTDPLGQLTVYEATYFDLPSAQTGPDGVRYAFAYDTELRLTTVTNSLGLTWEYGYDPAGRLVSEKDFNGRELTYGHDAAGQLVTRCNGAGETVDYTRDPAGQITAQRHGDGRTTSFRHDAAGRLLGAVNPDVELSFTRDVVGRITAETVNGRTVSSSYDLLGRRTSRTVPSGGVSAWAWDAAGRPTTLTSGGNDLAFGYDRVGRETSRRLSPTVELTQQWDSADRLASQALLVGEPVSRIVAATDPDRAPRQTLRRDYTYRADGYLTGIQDSATGLKSFELDGNGRVTAVRAEGWSERYAYDSLGNVTRAEWPVAAGSSGSGSGLGSGSKLSGSGSESGSSGSGSESVSKVSSSATSGEVQGSRTFSGTLIRTAGRSRYTHDAQGRVVRHTRRLLSGGVREWHYRWDAEDRMTGVTTPDGTVWRYLYDPLGRRVAKQRLAAGGTTVVQEVRFAWDGTRLAEQTDEGGISLSWDYTPGGYRPLTQTEHRPPAGDFDDQEEVDRRSYAIVTDLVGTPTELVDTDGTVVWQPHQSAWGTQCASTGENLYCPLRLPGQYQDPETGLHYNNQRYYDPQSGRYQTNDPLGLTPAPNSHGYVNNPLTSSDPLGLAPVCALPTGFVDRGGDIFESPGGLIYGPGSKQGHRVLHIMEHAAPNPAKLNHDVFKNTDQDDILKLIDKAWINRGAPDPNDPAAFIVNMGEDVGTAGQRNIRLIIKPGTNEIISAYPYK